MNLFIPEANQITSMRSLDYLFKDSRIYIGDIFIIKDSSAHIVKRKRGGRFSSVDGGNLSEPSPPPPEPISQLGLGATHDQSKGRGASPHRGS